MSVRRSTWLVSFSLTVLTVAIGGTLAGQQTAAPFTLNLSATDSHGQPVNGLKAEDFRILDNGKPLKIVSFEAAPANDAAQSAVFVLLDLFNANLEARGFTENELVRGFGKLTSAENVYLYLLTSTGAIYPVREPGERAGNGTRLKPALDEALNKVNGLKSQDDRYEMLRIEPTWKALFSLTNEMAKVPGPKSFLWITQGIENGVMQPGHEMIINTLPLRVFAARLAGLQTVALSVQERPNGSLAVDNTGSPGDTLRQLAELTGGRPYASDTVEKALADAVNNPPRLNYRLQFAPEKMDGKYHKLKITAVNKDVKVQGPQSYYASPLATDLSSAAK